MQELLDNSNSYADVLRAIGLSDHGGNRNTLRKVINDYNLDLTKINNNRSQQNLAQISRVQNKARPIEELLTENSPYKSSSLLKRLVKEGYKTLQCERCGVVDWMGEELSFHLHHKNGVHSDNTLSNLEVLCPNCHSQTENFAGKGQCKIPKLTKEQEKKKAYYGVSEDGQRFYDGYGNYKILCPVCKVNFMNREAKEMCKSCYEENRKKPKIPKEELFELMKTNNFPSAALILGVDRDTVARWYTYYVDEEKKLGNIIINSDKAPSKEELKEQLKKWKSFAGVGRIYDVRDNTIRKWCKKYGIPSYTKDIQNLSDEEWEKI